MKNLPLFYQTFILNTLHNNEWTDENITTLFNLHNNFVELNNPVYARSCSGCVQRAITRCRQEFPLPIPNFPTSENEINN